MNPKNTWAWVIIAAGLFSFIFYFERYLQKPASAPTRVLPGLKAGAVTGISVTPAGQREIRAERTNGVWQLTKPIAYPAEAAAVEALLAALEHLAPAKYLTASELRQQPNLSGQFGLDVPSVQLSIDGIQVKIGNRTAPGDQVYVEVVGSPGDYIVDADLLKLLPRTVTDWRDTALVDLRRLAFDRLIVSNATRVLEFQRNPTNHLWRMTKPFSTRADNDRIVNSLQQLQNLRVAQFIPGDPGVDLDTYGLEPPQLELTLASGTNPVAVLQFGTNSTNDASLVYGRRKDLDSIVTVASNSISPWFASRDDFRDRHLITLSAPIDRIEVSGEDTFALQREAGNAWRLVPQNLPVDRGRVNEFVETLGAMQIAQFDNRAVTETDWRDFGLVTPSLQIVLKSAVTNAAGTTNGLLAQAFFGTNLDDKVYVRCQDDSFLYLVSLADFQKLPAASWQLRDRRIWNFSENDVARLTLRQNGKVRQLIRNGTNSWSLAPGSQGILDGVAVAAIEETVHRLGELTAAAWVARGPATPDAPDRFRTNGYALAFELKNGGKPGLEFGATPLSPQPCAAVALDGQRWVFEFSPVLYYLVTNYLTIPAGVP